MLPTKQFEQIFSSARTFRRQLNCIGSLPAICAMLILTAIANAQPIDPMTAQGEYVGGGLSISADDLRRIAFGDEIGSRPRGGGGPSVLLVECNGAFGYSTIQVAIDDAVDGDIVLVLPNDCTEGGDWQERINFLGKAIRVQSANPTDESIVDATILNANQGGTGVSFVNGEGPDSVIDGLTVKFGAGGQGTGGGFTCYSSDPTIRRCLFYRNSAGGFGGGGFISGDVSPLIEGCRFVENTSGGSPGAAVYSFSPRLPTFVDCRFTGHTGSSAIYASTINQSTCGVENKCGEFVGCRFEDNATQTVVHGNSLLFERCDFINNAQQCINSGNLEIDDCLFEGNTGSGPGVVYSPFNSKIENSYFINNFSTSFILRVGLSSDLRGCTFDSNQSPQGSIVNVYLTDGEIEDCHFLNNESSRGTLDIFSQMPLRINRCLFENNMGRSAGGIRVTGGSGPNRPVILNSSFIANRSETYAGAIYATGIDLFNCLFIGNHADSSYGAILSTTGQVNGCTIVGNSAKGNFGGVHGATLTNTIVYNNRDASGQGQQSQISPAVRASYSNIENLMTNIGPSGQTNAQVGNISADPQFIDPGFWDDAGTPGDLSDDFFVPGNYRLRGGSPCLNTGDPNYVPAPGFDEDVAGNPRVVRCRIDMGAYETQQQLPQPGDFTGDGLVTLADLPIFLTVILEQYDGILCTADLNSDYKADGRDLAAFVELLIDG